MLANHAVTLAKAVLLIFLDSASLPWFCKSRCLTNNVCCRGTTGGSSPPWPTKFANFASLRA
jgi:hypothetical protein